MTGFIVEAPDCMGRISVILNGRVSPFVITITPRKGILLSDFISTVYCYGTSYTTDTVKEIT
jgi:hypothetical protein